MKFRGQPDHEIPRERLVRSFAATLAKLEVVVDGVPKCLHRLRWRTALERDDIANSEHFAVQEVRVGIGLYRAEVAFVPHHGANPAPVRNRLIDFTAPLSVSFRGCGR